jgi:uncharacterized protein (DUF58 family)
MYDGDVPSIFSVWLSLVLLWLLLFFALIRGDHSLAALAGGVLLLMHGSRLWTRLAFIGLSASVGCDRNRLFPDDTLLLNAELSNRKILPVRLRLELPAPKLLSGGDEYPLHSETRLLSYETGSRKWRLKANKRGVASLGPLRLTASDLLGLYRRQRKYPLEGEIVVFPRLGEMMPLDIPFQEYFGIHASVGPVEDPSWYAGTRDYSGNRPAKNIHWKASARLGVLQEKLYEPTSHRKVLFVLDSSGFPGLRYGDTSPAPADASGNIEAEDPGQVFEESISTLATLAAALMETGASFGLVTNAPLSGGKPRILPSGRGPEHLGLLLDMLARVGTGEADDLAPLLSRTLPGETGIIYCGYETGPGALAFLSSATSRRRKMLFLFSRSPAGRIWQGYPAYCCREVADVR